METDPPAPHRFGLRVYYEDTDFSGVVYHASYLRFLERGRTELLRDLGISQTDLFAGAWGQPIAFAVLAMTIEFRKPARMDDRLIVETRRLKLGGASLVLAQTLFRDAERLVDAQVRIVALSDGRVARLPAGLAAKLAAGPPPRPAGPPVAGDLADR